MQGTLSIAASACAANATVEHNLSMLSNVTYELCWHEPTCESMHISMGALGVSSRLCSSVHCSCLQLVYCIHCLMCACGLVTLLTHATAIHAQQPELMPHQLTY